LPQGRPRDILYPLEQERGRACFCRQMDSAPLNGGYSKRAMNDCYHNYLWLGFATGSVGGPIPWRCPMQSDTMYYYDLSGVNYLNPITDPIYNPDGYPLMYYTEEILDSLQSLSRFTSLVRWECISDTTATGQVYRPMRITGKSGGTTLTLKNALTGQPLSENDWLWTGASDGTVTVGWIVRKYPVNYDAFPGQNHPAEYVEDVTTPTISPRVQISGLSQIPLELTWFDDRKGCFVGNRTNSATGQFDLIAPDTMEGGFGKSVAFLIQPPGFTPNKTFAQVPNAKEPIGQIVVSPTYRWHDERPETSHSLQLTLTATTKPQLSNPNDYIYDWFIGDPVQREVRNGGRQITHQFGQGNIGYNKIRVDIKKQPGERVSGDVIYLWVD